jgi:hypothetical protein
MKDVYILVEQNSKQVRQSHINLDEPCLERGGNSTIHKGVLAQFLDTTIPSGTTVLLCHACNNGKCSNPNHLYWGTPKENIMDSIEAGTYFGGKKYIRKYICENTKKKISSTLKGRPSNNKEGKNGISTGKIKKGYRYKRKYLQQWITDGVSNTRIAVDSLIPEGWKKGRTV